MAGKVNYLPDSYHNVVPYISSDNVRGLIKFMQDVFSAKLDNEPMASPDGDIAHAEVTIGNSHIMLGMASPKFGKMPISLYVYVPDTDETYQKAVKAGATSLMEPADQFYGDRNAGVKDAFGNVWWIATHKEDLSHEEICKRAEAHHTAAVK